VGAPRDTNLFVGGGHRLLPHPAKNAVVRATPDGMRNAAGTCRKPRRRRWVIMSIHSSANVARSPSTCAHLTAAQIVLADGGVVECDEHQHQDLFWALRGPAAATSVSLRHSPSVRSWRRRPPYSILVWRGRYAADLIDAWQRWAPTGPDELDATLRLRIPANDARPRLEIVGTLLGTEADTTDLLADLVRRTATELSRNTGCCPIAWRSGHSRAMACSTVSRTHR
jgi:hypothetical protein